MVELGPEDTIEYWFNRFHSRDVKPDAAFEEIKEFAFKTELTTAMDSGEFNLKQKGFINFLLKRIGVIEETYIEQWADWRKGISLVDVQEYFARDN
jgi:hypothetical protein